MASDVTQRVDSCACYPDFAACCFFIEKFGELLGLLKLDINNLCEAFEDCSADVPDLISELHIYLLRRLKRNVPSDKWERQLVQFCSSYNNWHAWELEEMGYAKLRLSTKLAIIRNLLEAQFDGNLRFQERLKTDIPEEELRNQCYGRDRDGLCYWLIQDEQLTINVYRVEQDDTDGSSWHVVAKNREELSCLIECLKDNRPIPGLPAPSDSRSNTPISHVSSAADMNALISHSNTNTPSKLTISMSASDFKSPDPKAASAEVKSEPEANSSKAEVDSAPVKAETDSDNIDTAVIEPAAGNVKVESPQESRSSDTDNTHFAEKAGEIKDESKLSLDDGLGCDNSQTAVISQASDIERSSPPPSSNDPAFQAEELIEKFSASECETVALNLKGDEASTDLQVQTDQVAEADAVSNADAPPPSQAATGGMNRETDAVDDTDAPSPSRAAADDRSRETGTHSSSDSEDNVPLSQLKPACILLSQAKRSLMKAKKEHEKRKLKEMIRKKKEKTKKKTKKSSGIDSPQPTNTRTSNRARTTRVPIISSDDAVDSSDLDLLDDDDYVPKGRNARRQAKMSGVVLPPQDMASSEVDNDDTPCTSCGKYTQPHLILLCDRCDAGWHTGCVKPALFYIPDDDWYCPNCEHAVLVDKLEAHLVALDALIKSHEAKVKRLERQEKYALSNGINPENIIAAELTETKRSHREKRSRKLDEYEYDSWEEDYGYSQSKRSCRQRNKVSYRFDDYEDMINSAIKKNEASDPTIISGTNSKLLPPAGQSRGKDISNLLGEAGLTVSSEEEEDVKDEEEEEEGTKGKGKNMEPDEPKSSSKKKRKKLSNIEDNDSDGETDDDYSLSDEEVGGEEISEGSASDDPWVPRGVRSYRRRRRPDDVKSFICDEEEEESDSRRSRKAARRHTRTSAAAAQAAIRTKRAKFGFSSSEESLASTPGSSSSEEQVFPSRIKNKWNSSITYSANNKSSKTETGNKKKKKRRIIANYNSDQSTEQELSPSSDDEYVPPSETAEQDDKTNQSEQDEDKGVLKVNNRLDSSSDNHSDAEDTAQQSSPPDTALKSSPPDTPQRSSPPDTAQRSSLPDTAQQSSPPDTTQQSSPPDTAQRSSPPDTTHNSNAHKTNGDLPSEQQTLGKTEHFSVSKEQGQDSSDGGPNANSKDVEAREHDSNALIPNSTATMTTSNSSPAESKTAPSYPSHTLASSAAPSFPVVNNSAFQPTNASRPSQPVGLPPVHAYVPYNSTHYSMPYQQYPGYQSAPGHSQRPLVPAAVRAVPASAPSFRMLLGNGQQHGVAYPNHYQQQGPYPYPQPHAGAHYPPPPAPYHPAPYVAPTSQLQPSSFTVEDMIRPDSSKNFVSSPPKSSMNEIDDDDEIAPYLTMASFATRGSSKS